MVASDLGCYKVADGWAEERAERLGEIGSEASAPFDVDALEEGLIDLASKDGVGSEIGGMAILEEPERSDEVGLACVVRDLCSTEAISESRLFRLLIRSCAGSLAKNEPDTGAQMRNVRDAAGEFLGLRPVSIGWWRRATRSNGARRLWVGAPARPGS
jgi:hypothetical protein